MARDRATEEREKSPPLDSRALPIGVTHSGSCQTPKQVLTKVIRLAATYKGGDHGSYPRVHLV